MVPADLPVLLARIADALDRLAPPSTTANHLAETIAAGTDAFVWSPASPGRPADLLPVAAVSAPPLELLTGIDAQKRILRDNTARFASGLPGNNAMLWGARGTGKSSLVKAVHREVNAARPPQQPPLLLIEINRDDLSTLPLLLDLLREESRRIIVFCDDLSFEHQDADYKALKSVLDGGLRGRPGNVLFYATSNRRHLMPREMIDNERSAAVIPGEAVEEKISLSDRFGLWIGFHAVDQAAFLAMVAGYVAERGLSVDPERLRAEALGWASARGARSGRVAVQFVDDLEGRLRYEAATRSSPPM